MRPGHLLPLRHPPRSPRYDLTVPPRAPTGATYLSEHQPRSPVTEPSPLLKRPGRRAEASWVGRSGACPGLQASHASSSPCLSRPFPQAPLPLGPPFLHL